MGSETRPGPVAEDGRGLAALAVALEGEAGHGGRHEHEVVEARHPPAERVVAAELVAAELGHRVDVGDRLRRPAGRLAVVVGVRRTGDAPLDGPVAHGDGVLGRQIEGVLVGLLQLGLPVFGFSFDAGRRGPRSSNHEPRLGVAALEVPEALLGDHLAPVPARDPRARARRAPPRRTRPPPPAGSSMRASMPSDATGPASHTSPPQRESAQASPAPPRAMSRPAWAMKPER